MTAQHPRTRPRRADAERSRAAILAAAETVLGERPRAGLDDIARAAGVTRQTVYAHFSSREALVDAALEDVTAKVVAALDEAAAESAASEPAEDALLRLLATSWQVAGRYPLLAHAQPSGGGAAHDLHRPIADRLARVLRRGRRSGEFDARLPVDWLVPATIALAHAAAEEVVAGRRSDSAAERHLLESVRRLVSSGRPPRATTGS